MTIAHCSHKELSKLVPRADTVVISLYSTTSCPGPNLCGWLGHINLAVDVLDPQGQSASFAPMDEQATKIAEVLYDFIKDKENIIVQCEYGEIRSVAIARALAYIKGKGLKEVKNGKYIESTSRYESTFQGRTSGGIVRYFRKRGRESHVPRHPTIPRPDESSSR